MGLKECKRSICSLSCQSVTVLCFLLRRVWSKEWADTVYFKIPLLTSACLLCKGPGVTSLSAYMIIDFMQVQSLPKELQSETFPRMFQRLTSFPLAVKSRSLIHFTHFCGPVLLFILYLAKVQHWHGFYRSCLCEREKNDTRLERSSINWKCSNAI